MESICTVYFDTQFYIKLANADDEVSQVVISALNSLKVRHVLSPAIIFELLKNPKKQSENKKLYLRLRKLKNAPLVLRHPVTQSGFAPSWNVLLIDNIEAHALSNNLEKIRDLQTIAESWSISANNKSLNHVQQKNLEVTSWHKLNELGLLVNTDNPSKEEIFETGATLFSSLRGIFDFLPEPMRTNLKQIDFGGEPSEENARRISSELSSALGKDAVDSLELQSDLQKSATVSEDRPYRVATDNASEKESKALGRTLVDTEHMLLFSENANCIDFLQVDYPQLRIIQQQKPLHKLKEIGLDNRCFAAKDLIETVEKLKFLISTR